MAQGSHFLEALNSGSESPGPTSYTDVFSLTGELVQPAVLEPTAALRTAPNVSSVAVQAVCSGLYVNHAGLLADAVAFALVMDALTHQGPADAARIPASVCAQQIIPGVSPPAAVTGNAEVYVDAVRAFGSQPGVGQAPPLAPYAEGR